MFIKFIFEGDKNDWLAVFLIKLNFDSGDFCQVGELFSDEFMDFFSFLVFELSIFDLLRSVLFGPEVLDE